MRLLGPPLDDAERAAVFASAMALLGTPWRHMGRLGCGYGHQTGLDCVGGLIRLMRDAGRPVGDIDVYARTSDGRVLLGELDAWLGDRLPPAAVAPWQVVHIPMGRSYQHVGLTLPHGEQTYLWHAYNGTFPAGRVMWHRLDEAWRKRITAGWAL